MRFEFIELSSFAEIRDSLFTDDEFLELQLYLCQQPAAGDTIPGTAGCRKLRWAARGKGKRGGARVVYFIRLTPARSCSSPPTGKENAKTFPANGCAGSRRPST